MAKQIELKKRYLGNYLQVPVQLADGLVDIEADGERLAAYDRVFKQRDLFQQVSDVVHLQRIINWVPQGGLAFTEMAKWHKLAKRAGDLDPEKEGAFTISSYELELLRGRLKDARFTLMPSPDIQPYLEFMVELAEVLGIDLGIDEGEED
ncbi:MAG: hypothetical protein C4540_02550 [Candidatus Omnitrophota bacterium]|nr:MAG: hypothetical protein C4540_02550 [Candidatus Omnitrophota bacterium]